MGRGAFPTCLSMNALSSERRCSFAASRALSASRLAAASRASLSRFLRMYSPARVRCSAVMTCHVARAQGEVR